MSFQAYIKQLCISFASCRRLCFLSVVVPLTLSLYGCGASIAASAPVSQETGIIESATKSTQVGHRVSFTTAATHNKCVWTSSDTRVLTSLGEGFFEGKSEGVAPITVTCGSAVGDAWVLVLGHEASPAITITKGGTYSGIWSSTSPKTPAVTINTDQPVILENSIITGKGPLIAINGTGAGANVQVSNVTGFAEDPGIAGTQRAVFMIANIVSRLQVDHCSMIGVSSGVKVWPSNVSKLVITNNVASQLEDRASDGQGGLTPARPGLGHFVILNNISALEGATIAWNQVIQIIGQSSTEDVINIYQSKGAPGQPIWIHDNYIEGNSSTTTTLGYTGSGIVTDGFTTGTQTAYVLIESNEVVHTAGSGIEIANGHDVRAQNNRVVSCGKDSANNWYAMTYDNAIIMYNAYNSPAYYNNVVTGTVGGMIVPVSGNPEAQDLWANAADMLNPGMSVAGNAFTDPCISGSTINLNAESTERGFWAAKVKQEETLIGDQHLL